jgi:hypothetical protein
MEGLPATMIRSPGLQAGGLGVQVDEAGGHAGDFAGIVAVVEFVDAGDHFHQQRLHRLESLRGLGAGFLDLEHLGFGLIEDFRGAAAFGAEGRIRISAPTSTSLRSTERSRTISA